MQATLLRALLKAALIPLGAMAAFFIVYAILYPAFWWSEVSFSGKVFEAGMLVLAATTVSLIRQPERVERHPNAATAVLMVGLLATTYVFASSFKALGSF